VREAASIDTTARPSAALTCCVVAKMPDATPESSPEAPLMANVAMAGMATPKPTPSGSSAGRMSVA